MKKLVLLIFALVIAIGVQGTPFKVARTIGSNSMIVNKEMPVKHKMVKGSPRTHTLSGASRIISEQPAGEAKTYRRTGNCVYINQSSISTGSESGMTTIVFGSDNKVYIKDVLYGTGNFYGSAWIEGTIDGNTITVPLGQSIYYDDSYQADVVLAWGSTYIYDNDGLKIGFTEDASVTEVTFTIDPEAKTISLNGGDQPEIPEEFVNYASYFGTGLCCKWTDDDSFGGFLAKNTVFTEVDTNDLPTVITDQPDGELITYSRFGGYISSSAFGVSNGSLDGKVNVVFTDNGKVYIQNPLWYHDGYGSWVEGTYDVETSIISVPTGQYLYWDDDDYYGVRVGWGETTVTESGVDENGKPQYVLGYGLLDEDNIFFQVDNDRKLITLLNTQGDISAEFPMNYVATGIMGYWSDDESMTVVEFGETFEMLEAVPAVPADPTADEWYDCGDESGFSRLYFTLPTTDVNGNTLDPEFLSYSIFIDNGNGAELFTFPAADYTFDLTDEDITEVPYSLYSDAVDFKNYFVYMYRTNAEGYEPLFTENIGIQVYYTVDGVRNESHIAWLYERPAEPVRAFGNVVDMEANPIGGVEVAFTPVVEEQGEGAPRRAEAEPVVVITNSEGAFEAELAPNTEYHAVFTYGEETYENDIDVEEEDVDMGTIVLNVYVTAINDPTADDWYDCGDESGFSKFYFTLPTTDVNGNTLNPEFLSYSIFIDNGNGAELFTFPAADYTFDLTEDITEVPNSLYSNAVDFKNYFVYMYRTNVEGYEPLFTENIGIQVYYTVNDIRRASNIAWLYERPDEPAEPVLVYGTVVDQDENPLSGVTVSFTPVVEEQGEGAPRRAEAEPVNVITDSEGYFEAELAPNTEYHVVFTNGAATVDMDIDVEDEDVDMGTIVMNVIVTGINDMTANKQVASTTYFDLAGRQVNNPTDGVFVKSVRYTDGTVVTVKVIK